MERAKLKIAIELDTQIKDLRNTAETINLSIVRYHSGYEDYHPIRVSGNTRNILNTIERESLDFFVKSIYKKITELEQELDDL